MSKEVPPARKVCGAVCGQNGDAPWSILSALEQNVLDKMQVKGTPHSRMGRKDQQRHKDGLQQGVHH